MHTLDSLGTEETRTTLYFSSKVSYPHVLAQEIMRTLHIERWKESENHQVIDECRCSQQRVSECEYHYECFRCCLHDDDEKDGDDDDINYNGDGRGNHDEDDNVDD